MNESLSAGHTPVSQVGCEGGPPGVTHLGGATHSVASMGLLAACHSVKAERDCRVGMMVACASVFAGDEEGV